MNRPHFHNQALHRKHVKVERKSETIAKVHQKPSSTVSYTEILNCDNSVIMDLDIEKLEEESRNQTNKRKSDENLPLEHVFKSPQPPKKAKRSLSPANPPPEPAESYSQQFFSSQDSLFLTQSCGFVNNFEEELVEEIIRNPETCSQYIQFNHKKEVHPLLDDSLNDLFINSQIEEAPPVPAADANNENYQEYIDAIEEDDDLMFEAESSPELEQKPSLIRPKLLPVSSGGGFLELGSFFGLTKRHREFVFASKNIESLYDWQAECLNLRAIHDRTNLIYALPTSGGKTLVAEITMLREIILRKKNVIFVLPFVSIVQEKVQDLTPFAMEFDFLIEEYCAGKGSLPPVKRRKKNTIYICTIEKSQILFDSLNENGRIGEIGLIVVDELHMVGDRSRGHSLETLLTKVSFQTEVKIQIIGMSATISNLQEIAKFLKADVYTRDFRPVELKEYVKLGSEILSIDGNAQTVADAFKFERHFGDDYSPKLLKRDPDHLAGLVIEVCPKYSCLVFCATKQNCENVAVLVSDLVPMDFKKVRRDEKENLIEAMKSDSNGRMCPILAKTIPFGIAYHHSGLTTDERKHLEEAFRLGIICAICCTSTLAAGVNLPAKRVIIRSPYIGAQFLTLTSYKQIVGRAGRKGKSDTGESIIICDPRDHQKLTELLCSTMDETVSGFVHDLSGKYLRAVVMNLIGTKVATSIERLLEFFSHSLLKVQSERFDKTLKEMINESCKELLNDGAVCLGDLGTRNAVFKMRLGLDEIEVRLDATLEVSKLGKAAVNSGMCLEDARNVEQDLVKAHEALVPSQMLHLLYIVVPTDNIDGVKLDFNDFGSSFMNLPLSIIQTAKTIGITENLAMKMITRPGKVKESEKEIAKRFHVSMILFELWNGKDIYEVAKRFKVNRGFVHGLMNAASSRAFSIFKFCEMYEEFWVFQEILEKFSKRLAYCCSAELLPLMELPAVKIGRAKLMYNAGFKTVEDLAAITPEELIKSVQNVNKSQATTIIKAAKHAVKERIETIQDRLDEMKDIVKKKEKSN